MKRAIRAVRRPFPETFGARLEGIMVLDIVVSVWLFLAVAIGSLVLWESRGRL